MKRPVVFVSHEPGCGGAELSLLDLLYGLDRERHPPLLVTSAPGELTTRAEAMGVRCEFLPLLARGWLARLRQVRAAALGLARIVEQHRATILHSNTLIAGYASVLAGRRSGVATVWHVRDIGYPWIARRACLAASAIVANSHATADALRAPPTKRARVHVVYNGVAAAFFADVPRGRLRSELALEATTPLVGLVARGDPWKGHEDLIRATPLLLQRVADVHVVVLGGQPLREGRAPRSFLDEMRALAEQLGVAHRVHFLGQRHDVADLVRDLDVLAHPVREPEPFGRAIAEAFAAGKPVVASALGGLQELVSDHVTGRLTPPRDPPALAAALADVLLDPEVRARLGAAARAFAQRECTTAVHARRVHEVYAQLPG